MQFVRPLGAPIENKSNVTNHATPAPGKAKTTTSKPLQVDENGMLISR